MKLDINKIITESVQTVAEGDMYTTDQMKEAAAALNKKPAVKPVLGPVRKTPPGNIERGWEGVKKFGREVDSGERNVQNIPGRVKQFYGELKSGDRNIQNMPGAVKAFAQKNFTLTPGKMDKGGTAGLLGAGAIAAGMGAMALRKRMAKAKASKLAKGA